MTGNAQDPENTTGDEGSKARGRPAPRYDASGGLHGRGRRGRLRGRAGGPRPSPPSPPVIASTASAPRTLLDTAGAGFLVTAYQGRLPAAMNQLGLLLVVSASGRGLTLAGAMVAAVGAGTALGAPGIGRLHDRVGAWRVTVCALAVQTGALAVIRWATDCGAADGIVLAAGAVTGMANPQVGSVARAAWSHLARASGQRDRALRVARLGMGWETAADETSFVIGPAAAGGLVALLGARGAVVALAAVTLAGEGVFVLWLLGHREIARPCADGPGDPARRDRRARTAAASMRPLAPVLTVVVCVGVVFGTTQTALTAVHAAHGTPGLTGPVYGSMGLTSAAAGLVSPGLRAGRLGKTAVGGLAVLLCSMALTSVPPTVLTEIVILCLGAAVGMMLVTCYSRVEELSPADQVTGVMTVASTCNVLGVSLGSVITGAIGENLHLGNAPAAIAGGCVTALALGEAAVRRHGRRARRHGRSRHPDQDG